MIANAGGYTLPEWREGPAAYPWPHSLLHARVGEAGSQAQGPNRLSRDLYYLNQVQRLAREPQSPWPWR